VSLKLRTHTKLEQVSFCSAYLPHKGLSVSAVL